MTTPSSSVYLTWPRKAQPLPTYLRQDFLELDQLMRSLMGSAQHQIILISPYLGWKGIREMRDALAVSCGRGAWLRIITSDAPTEREANRAALAELVSGAGGNVIRSRLRVLTPADGVTFLIHGKAVLIDGGRGYLGSANMSFNGIDVNVEFGVSLAYGQVDSLTRLVSFLEAKSLMLDITSRALETT
jgi:phosphatidylserine/phosphatidylglycerophosphate/cardiolipin synthase-like enzyme